MTREQIIAGFHRVYLAKIEEATRQRGAIGAASGGGIPVKDLTKIHNEAIADYVEGLLNATTA